METYKCIKSIKYKRTTFNVGEEVVIITEGDKYILLSDLNYTKGLSIEKNNKHMYIKKACN